MKSLRWYLLIGTYGLRRQEKEEFFSKKISVHDKEIPERRGSSFKTLVVNVSLSRLQPSRNTSDEVGDLVWEHSVLRTHQTLF